MTAVKEPLTRQTIGGLIPEPVGEIEHTSKINMLIYGEPGVGKTHLAGSADEIAEWRKVLHLDVEGGSMTLRRTFPRVETLRIYSWSELKAVYDDLFDTDGGEYGTVILDNLTEVQSLCKTKVMEDAKKTSPNPEQIDPEVLRQRDWGVVATRMLLMVRQFRDLPMNFICTAHVKEDFDNSNKRKLKPMLQGSAKQEVPGAFDIVAYLHNEQVDGKPARLFSTRESRDYIAKERDTELPANLANATMANILSYIPKE